MTDTKIKKALECCTNRDVSCVGCPFEKDNFCSRKILQGSLAYINQLEAEADKIAEDYSNLMIKKDELFDEAEKLIKNAKAEAIKEFAEKFNRVIDNLLKTYSVLEKYSVADFDEFKAIRQVLRGLRNDIDNIAKEMASENNVD